MPVTLGRKTRYDEPLSEKIRVLFTPTQIEQLEKKYPGEELSSLIREIMLGERVLETAISSQSTNVMSPIIGGAICGPFSEATADNDALFSISEDMAKELGYIDGDVWVESHGQSMEKRGIIDGGLVLMRPIPPGRTPRRDEIALVQIFTSSGECLSTIKRWNGSGRDVMLLDGEDNEYSIPEDVERIEPVATAQGVIGRL